MKWLNCWTRVEILVISWSKWGIKIVEISVSTFKSDLIRNLSQDSRVYYHQFRSVVRFSPSCALYFCILSHTLVKAIGFAGPGLAQWVDLGSLRRLILDLDGALVDDFELAICVRLTAPPGRVDCLTVILTGIIVIFTCLQLIVVYKLDRIASLVGDSFRFILHLFSELGLAINLPVRLINNVNIGSPQLAGHWFAESHWKTAWGRVGDDRLHRWRRIALHLELVVTLAEGVLVSIQVVIVIICNVFVGCMCRWDMLRAHVRLGVQLRWIFIHHALLKGMFTWESLKQGYGPMSLLVCYVNTWYLFRFVVFTRCKVESAHVDLLVDA